MRFRVWLALGTLAGVILLLAWGLTRDLLGLIK